MLEITFLTIPVVIGAMICGPVSGAILGGVFGVTSFIQCFGISTFGTTLCGINPVYTFIVCVITRILTGWFSGLIFQAISKKDSKKIISCIVTAGFGAICNTVLFVGSLLLFFGRTDYIKSIGDTAWKVIVAIVGTNGLVEAAVCLVVGAAVSKAILVLINDRRIRK